MDTLHAHQLRVGNWMRYTGLGNKGDKDYCYITELHLGQVITGMQPIQLTPDIIERLGFYFNDGIFDIPDEILSVGITGIGPYFMFVFGKTTVGKPFQWVHQFQNLFFELLQKDLLINLTHLT